MTRCHFVWAGIFAGALLVDVCAGPRDGFEWTSGFGPRGIVRGSPAVVSALTVFDPPGMAGPALHLGGDFTVAGGVSANHIARWDGQAWSALGSGTDGPVSTMAGYDDRNGPALYVGGSFLCAGGTPSAYIARWGCVPGRMLDAAGYVEAASAVSTP